MNNIQELPTKYLPNRDGFMFIAICRDGKRQKCKVIRRSDGIHRVRGVKFDEIVSWVPIDGRIY
jgi:hypothetical protein